ncbi:hypothetical protein Hanom_Chr12g01151981 [Helianthus anomalus]
MGIYIRWGVREDHLSSSVAIFFLLFALKSSLNLLTFIGAVADLQVQITRGFRFPPEWDTRYPGQNQTAADAPPGYITLFEDFFLQGNFRLSATNFMAHILQYYGFHISQMSPPDMVSVRHFEFLCRAHEIEPTVENSGYSINLSETWGSFTTHPFNSLMIPTCNTRLLFFF